MCVSKFSDVMCVQLRVSPYKNLRMCILMLLFLEERVWNVLQRSGMSVALDPSRLLVDGPQKTEDISLFSCANQKRLQRQK